MRLQKYESPNPKVQVFLRLVDRCGYFALRLFRARRAGNLAAGGKFKKILLVRCDGIGDLVFSTPAITAVRSRYPDARLDLVVGPWSRDVAAMIPGIDNIILHAPWGYRKLRSVQEGTWFWEDLRFARHIRRERYDIAIDLRGDLLSILPMWFWNIPVRVARATRGGGFALTKVVNPAAAGREHEVERTLDVVGALGAVANEETPRLQVSSAVRDSARDSFARRGIDITTSILMLPGAQWLWRQWPSENFRNLGRLLLDQGHCVVVVGAKTDETLLDAVVQDAPEK